MTAENNGIKEAISVLIIGVGEAMYAVKASEITEVVPMMSIRRFPDLPSFLEGFIDIRGELYAVVDLCKQFGGDRRQYVYANRIILIRCQGRNLGFIVDEIVSVDEWHPDTYQKGILSENVKDAFTGVVGQTAAGDVQVLNLCKILSEKKLSLIAERAEAT